MSETDPFALPAQIVTTYCRLAYIAFGLQLCSVVGSSVVCIQLLAGGFDPRADNAIVLLLREFEMLFLTVQICFSVGLIAFLATIITRVWVVYNKESERKLVSSIT